MARRKSKRPPPEDTSIRWDSSPPPPPPQPGTRRRIHSDASPALLFIAFAVGSSVLATFSVQQQHSLDQLTESFGTMRRTMTNLHQVMEMDRVMQTGSGSDVVERIFALEETRQQAQERVRVALDASEKMKDPDFYLQLRVLHGEIDTQLAAIKQVALSVATLQASFQNQSEEFDAAKESTVAALSSSSALVENVAGLATAVASAYSRADEQVASVEALTGQLGGHASELNELKESVHLHNGALLRNDQELSAMRELVEAKRAMRAQALKEMLSSVLKTLDEQFFTSQSLHSSVLARLLQTFHTQRAKSPSQSDEEGPAEGEFNSTTMQNATHGVPEKLSDVEAKTEQEESEDEAKEETMQEEPPPARGMEEDFSEHGEEDIFAKEEKLITTAERKDEEITGAGGCRGDS